MNKLQLISGSRIAGGFSLAIPGGLMILEVVSLPGEP